MSDIYAFLLDHGIAYQKCEHPAVFTVAEVERLVPALPGAQTKNLFLRDKKGTRHLLVVVGYDKQVDIKALSKLLAIDNLSFASPERLKKHLGIEPGAVSLLGLVNDADRAVGVIIDRGLWTATAFHCHPLVNTATLVISRSGIERFLQATGHAMRVLDVPASRREETLEGRP